MSELNLPTEDGAVIRWVDRFGPLTAVLDICDWRIGGRIVLEHELRRIIGTATVYVADWRALGEEAFVDPHPFISFDGQRGRRSGRWTTWEYRPRTRAEFDTDNSGVTS